MDNYQQGFVTANGIRIHYYRAAGGEGKPPVVLLHGLTDNGMCWVRVADRLKDRYDVIMPDTRGHGQSEKPEKGYSIDERAADVAGLIDALGLDRPVVMGHSLGGEAATAVGGLYGENVRALILEDPAWFAPNPDPAGTAEQAAGWRAGLVADKAAGKDGIIAMGRAQNPLWHEDEFGPWADSKLEMSETALVEILYSMVGGWQDHLAQVRVPVLLLTPNPEKGILNSVLVSEAQAISSQVREANFSEAGHCVHRDQFEPVMAAVEAFLAEVM